MLDVEQGVDCLLDQIARQGRSFAVAQAQRIDLQQ